MGGHSHVGGSDGSHCREKKNQTYKTNPGDGDDVHISAPASKGEWPSHEMNPVTINKKGKDDSNIR